MKWSAVALCLVSCAPATRSAVTPPASGATQNEGFVTADDGLRLYYRLAGSGAQTVIVPASLFLYRDLSRLAMRDLPSGFQTRVNTRTSGR